MGVEATFDVGTATWVAWDETTETTGFGDDAASAVADYWDNVREFYDCLESLGNAKVSPRLWAKLPALRQALGIDP